MPYNTYVNSIPYYNGNMYRSSYRQFSPMGGRPRPPMGNRPFGGGFVLPFALGFLSAPLLLRPNYYPNYYYRPPYQNYYPYY